MARGLSCPLGIFPGLFPGWCKAYRGLGCCLGFGGPGLTAEMQAWPDQHVATASRQGSDGRCWFIQRGRAEANGTCQSPFPSSDPLSAVVMASGDRKPDPTHHGGRSQIQYASNSQQTPYLRPQRKGITPNPGGRSCSGSSSVTRLASPRCLERLFTPRFPLSRPERSNRSIPWSLHARSLPLSHHALLAFELPSLPSEC